jgi:hypothetical protein
MKEKALLGNPYIGEQRGGRPAKYGARSASPCCHCISTLSQRCGGSAKEVDSVGERKKGGEGGQPTTNLWPTDHAWPPLNPYFPPPFHLAPIMLTPLTKSIKSKTIFFHPFPKFYLFIYLEFLDFILCNDEVNMLWKMSK